MEHSRMYDPGVSDLTKEQATGNGAGPEASMTIDELARRTGMTVRNIRAHQSRGLVPPPQVRGRTGYYGDEHVARIELIKELQGDGFNLEAIRRLLEGAGGSSSEVLDFSRTLRAPFEDEQPEIVEEAEMEERWGGRRRCARTRAGWRGCSSTSSCRASGSRSIRRGGPRRTGRRCARRWSACARWPPTRSW